jgi:hypothetical protein
MIQQLIAVSIGAVVTFLAKDRRQEQIDKEVQRQLAEQQKQG